MGLIWRCGCLSRNVNIWYLWYLYAYIIYCFDPWLGRFQVSLVFIPGFYVRNISNFSNPGEPGLEPGEGLINELWAHIQRDHIQKWTRVVQTAIKQWNCEAKLQKIKGNLPRHPQNILFYFFIIHVFIFFLKKKYVFLFFLICFYFFYVFL